MSGLVEELLKITSYEEFDKRREEFRNLPKNDPRVRQHLNKIFPQIHDRVKNGVIIDVQKNKPKPR